MKRISGTASVDLSVLMRAAAGISCGGIVNRRPAIPLDSALYQIGVQVLNVAEHVPEVSEGRDDVAKLIR